jgi:hypothetical protein
MSTGSTDPEIWNTARQRLPLPLLLTKLGDGSHTKKGADCPFCGTGKGKWAIFEKGGKHFFKCHEPDCVANENEVGHNEIAYIQLRRGMEAKEAAKEYLRLAVPDLVPELFDRPPERKARKARLGLGEEDDDEIPGIAPAAPPPPPPPRDGEARNVWHALWKKLPLTVDDRAKLRVARGLSDDTINRLGFRSNNGSNFHHLQALADDFSLDELIAEGIYKDEGSRGAKASGQFQGWGITDQKDKTGKAIFEQTEPILIPYLDADGVPFYMRPHKGGVKKPKDELEELDLDEDAPESCASHVYCPYLLVELILFNDGLCVLTEGEFKAAALWQCGIAAIACPGIQFVRNQAFRAELVEILRTFGVTDLVVIFDNEVKDDPAFPKRYKADPWKRWDTPMWAEYTAIDLKDYFASRGTCRIGWLPDQYRVEGKADCDGILAQMVHKYGMDEGTRQARRIFLQTIESSSEKPTIDLFPSESRRIIECKLSRLYYKPLVQLGGNKEMTLARRFAEHDENGRIVDKPMADLFRSLRGCYYKRAKPKEKHLDSLHEEKVALQKTIEELKEAGKSATPQWERARRQKLRIAHAKLAVVWENLKGIPEPLSNFTLACEYKLHTTLGDVHRLVNVRDSKERTKRDAAMRRLAPSDLARLADFRKWCYSTGEAVWTGGDKELQHLVQDMDHHSFLRDIHEITTYGFHPASKLWFFGDVAFGPDGRPILPDASNIFWYDGIGYQIDQSIHERGESFVQGSPLLLQPQGTVPPLENPDVPAMFRQLSEDLFNTVGGYDGWLIMGMIAAYAIAPELIRAGGHPGLWLFGKMSSGKTTVARWAMRVWGFKELGGIRIGESTTSTAMNRFLAQYNSLPVWMDEYRRLSVDAQREEVLRGAFDRSSAAKGVADHSNKTRNATILTMPVISGESSSGDAATRSRYGHVNVSAHKRIGDGHARYVRVQNEQLHFYHIGYWLMSNRKAFAEKTIALLESWMADPTVKAAIINERVRFVHGTAYASFYTLADMLGMGKSVTVPENADSDEDPDRTNTQAARFRIAEFQSYLFKHGEQALADVIEETFINSFWRDIISGIQLAKISRKLLVTRYVKVLPDGRLTEVNANEDGAIHVVYVASESVFASYQAYKAGRREDAQQQLSDIRREMEKEPYWIPAPKSKDARVHRISIIGHKTSCWVITLEKEPPVNGRPGRYLFPFAEDIIDSLTEEAHEVEEPT